MKYRLINPAFLVTLLFAALGTAFLASRISIVLAIVLGFAVPATLLNLAHNRNPFTARLRKRDDQLVFRGWEAGIFTAPRRFYRRLPADPRRRLCLVPFGGVGGPLRIKPSGNYANFCTDCLAFAPVG